MKIEFYPETDAMYVHLTDAKAETTEEIKHGILFDYDATGNVVGIEVLHISRRAEQPEKQAA